MNEEMGVCHESGNVITGAEELDLRSVLLGCFLQGVGIVLATDEEVKVWCFGVGEALDEEVEAFAMEVRSYKKEDLGLWRFLEDLGDDFRGGAVGGGGFFKPRREDGVA